MKDNLRKVLSAIEKGSGWNDPKARVDFTLISYHTLSRRDETSIRNLQVWTQKIYRISLKVVGGRYGCSRVDFEVEAPTAEIAADYTRKIIREEGFLDRVSSIGFKVIIRDVPYTRIDVKSGIVQGGAELLKTVIERGINVSIDNRDQSTKICAPVTNSMLTLHSENTMQTMNGDFGLEGILARILEIAREDDNISKKEYIMVSKLIEELKTELSKSNPQLTVIERIMGNMGSIASIASWVNLINPYLPALF